jgi:protein phosphatase
MGDSSLLIEADGATHVGRRRVRNEDACGVFPELGLFAVADGVATRPDGDIASEMAIDLVRSFLVHVGKTGAAGWLDDAPTRFVAAVHHANDRIYRSGRSQVSMRGMAATFAGVLLDGPRLHVLHVGDSRVYRLRGGQLEALTADHSFANDLIAGGMPAAEAEAMPAGAALSRALGIEPHVDVTIRLEAAEPGDVLLLCSDGLHGVVPAAEIAGILGALGGVEAMVDALIARANERGGPDNVTAVIVRLTLAALDGRARTLDYERCHT